MSVLLFLCIFTEEGKALRTGLYLAGTLRVRRAVTWITWGKRLLDLCAKE